MTPEEWTVVLGSAVVATAVGFTVERIVRAVIARVRAYRKGR
jgi:hypothetical protein